MGIGEDGDFRHVHVRFLEFELTAVMSDLTTERQLGNDLAQFVLTVRVLLLVNCTPDVPPNVLQAVDSILDRVTPYFKEHWCMTETASPPSPKE